MHTILMQSRSSLKNAVNDDQVKHPSALSYHLLRSICIWPMYLLGGSTEIRIDFCGRCNCWQPAVGEVYHSSTQIVFFDLC